MAHLMTVVHQDVYLTITYHEDLDLIETASRIKDEADLKRYLLKFVEMMEQYNVDKILWDLREFKLVIDPDFERWIDENISAKQVKSGIVKKAYIMPPDFNIALGIEESLDNEYARQIETAYFRTREQALDWLKETD
jgi:hypothetical protein